MTPLYDSQEFYKKMLELQERLRKSEDERMKLEERFNLLSQESRSRRETCINNLRMRYIDFLEEQRLRDERNHDILGALDKIDGSLARMTARTDRLGILRKQYEAYLLRVYANRNSGGGTGDSGVGSHNEDRSPKTNVSPTDKIPLLKQRVVTLNADNNPATTLIPPENYPQSYIGATNMTQFSVPRYTPAQGTSQVRVMQGHGQGDSSAILPHSRIPPELFCGTKNLQSILSTSVPKAQLMPNVSQEFLPLNRTFAQGFSADTDSRSSNQLAPNYSQIQHHQLRDISNQYLDNGRSPYGRDPSMARMQNLTDPLDIISSDLPGLQSARGNPRSAVDFSADSTDEIFGPHRHSTPLPGYLDYSTRYSRDPSEREPNVALRHSFTKSDLENVIQRNEPLLPKDYFHNSETVAPTMRTSKLSSRPVDNQKKTAGANPSRGSNDDDLDKYINRIRSLHRDNDQSLEVLDIDQNTSGDLLNATLSDDGPEPFTLQSDDKNKTNDTKILPEDMKNVFSLADEFVAETGNSNDLESKLKAASLNERKINSKSVPSPEIGQENIVAKPAVTESSDASPVVLKGDMTSEDLSISVTRDDILSGTASLGVDQIHDKSANANSKFKPKITPPISNVVTSRLNITDIATLSKNNVVDSRKILPNDENTGNQAIGSSSQDYPEISNKESDDEKKLIKKQSYEQLVTIDKVRKQMEDHRDIEGDKVSLIKGEDIRERVIDVAEELQPQNLQHYKTNVVETRPDDEDKVDANARSILPDGLNIQENTAPVGITAAKSSPQDSNAEQIYAEYDQKYPAGSEEIENDIPDYPENDMNEDARYQNDAELEYELNPSHDDQVYEHQYDQNLVENENENHYASQGFQQNPEQFYNPDISRQHIYDNMQADDESNQHEQQYVPEADEPYASDPIYDSNQQYETDPSRSYARESNQQFAYDPNQHSEDDPNGQYAGDSNTRYIPDPNEQYVVDPNDEYVADPNQHYPAESNEQYAIDSNADYTTDPNAQYAYYENQPYHTDPNATYEDADNEQYHHSANRAYQRNPNLEYEHDPNQPYQPDPNQEYQLDPNQQYLHDPSQQYEHDPNQQYEQDPNQQYEHDPNQQYEHGPTQQYEHDLNQQYEHDPNQEYDHIPSESLAPYPNTEYDEREYERNQIAETIGYDESQYADNEQFANDLQQNNAGFNPAVGPESDEIQAVATDSYIHELADPDEIGDKEYSTDGKKKNKDVISALLETDTESTIERNPSNNTESDFDFN